MVGQLTPAPNPTQVISTCCTKLRALDLSYSPHITEAGLSPLVSACSELEELDISSCPSALSDQLLATLGQCCPTLSSLYLELESGSANADECSTVSSQALAQLVSGCTQLSVSMVLNQHLSACKGQHAGVLLPCRTMPIHASHE